MKNNYNLILMSYWRFSSEWLAKYLHGKSISSIAYIMNAEKVNVANNPGFIFNDAEFLKQKGFNVEIIDIEAANNNFDKLLSFDAIYLRGGNTFDLLDSIQKSSFSNMSCQLAEKGIYFIGSSAGSTVIGPNISIANNDFAPDYNNAGITDFTGLNLVDFAIFPHWQDAYREDLSEFIKDRNITYPVTCLYDNELILVESGIARKLKVSTAGEIDSESNWNE